MVFLHYYLPMTKWTNGIIETRIVTTQRMMREINAGGIKNKVYHHFFHDGDSFTICFSLSLFEQSVFHFKVTSTYL